MKPVKVGVIGCGDISAAYVKAAKGFPALDLAALSGLDAEAAASAAAKAPISTRSARPCARAAALCYKPAGAASSLPP